MKNLCRLILATLFVIPLAMVIDAREVSNPSSSTPDAWSAAGGNCYSGGLVTGCEVAVDYNGNLLPTVTNSQTLGTSSLLWSNVYATKVTAGSGGLNAGTGPTQLSIQTTNYLYAQTAPVVGSVYLVQEEDQAVLSTNAYNICVATAAAVDSFVYVSVSTNAAGGAVAGVACIK